jgi:hypothetical protein
MYILIFEKEIIGIFTSSKHMTDTISEKIVGQPKSFINKFKYMKFIPNQVDMKLCNFKISNSNLLEDINIKEELE